MVSVGTAGEILKLNNGNKLGELTMKTWKTPRLREICVGLEINSYACARL
jgi:coenzyme PQQ precursor peptide PqqA